jgi:hypothetical protein
MAACNDLLGQSEFSGATRPWRIPPLEGVSAAGL